MKAIFISVRTGSTRLPNKSILKIKDKFTIEYVIDNVKKCTTELKEDKILCSIAEKNGINFYCGSELNKFKRWQGACERFDIDFFVTADGDDLFYDAGLSDLCFEQIKDNDFIDGRGLYNDVYGMKYSTLKTILDIPTETNIEPYEIVKFLKNTNLKIKKLTDVPDTYKKRNIRMTLDYEEDFKFFSTVIENLKLDFSIKNVLNYIDDNPDVRYINYYRELDWKKNQGTENE